MSINHERLDFAMKEIEKALKKSGYNPKSPIMDLLREARAYAGSVRTLQAKYIQLAQEHLAEKQIFNWDRSDSNAAFNWDIAQYERLIEYCLIASDYQLLEWGLNCHRQYVSAQTIRQFYAPKLEQCRKSNYQELYLKNPEAAEELNACYSYLIQLLMAA